MGRKVKSALRIFDCKNLPLFANTLGAGLEQCLDDEVIDFIKVKEIQGRGGVG